MIKSHGGLLIGVLENRTAMSAKPKNCSKSTRPSSITTAVIHTFEIVENECIFAKIQFLVSQPVEDLQAVIAQLLGCINSSSFRHRVATARAIMVYVTTPTNIPEELIWYASVPRLPLRIFRVGSRSGTARLTLFFTTMCFISI